VGYFLSGGEDGNRTRLNGFAGRSLSNGIKHLQKHRFFRHFWPYFQQKLSPRQHFDLAQQDIFKYKILLDV
jgi:hypothetical protein